MNKKYLKLLEGLKSQIENLPHLDSSKLNALKQRAGMLINKIFDNTNTYQNTLKELSFEPIIVMSSGSSHPYDSAWKRGVKEFINLVNTMIEDVSLSIEDSGIKIESPIEPISLVKSVFIVHGHNEEMKQSVARLIEKLGLNPIILHEQPNKGNTIIQKFINYSSVGFAIVLMSGDDYGYSKSEHHNKASLRARQNVILELGFFIGKLGSERVLALFEAKENFEIPSDYSGILFTPYDSNGRWKFDLARELKTAGYKIDANLIL